MALMSSLEAGEKCQTEPKQTHVHGCLGGRAYMEAGCNEQTDIPQVRNAFPLEKEYLDAAPTLDGEHLADDSGDFEQYTTK